MTTKIGMILLALLAGWFLVLRPALGGSRGRVQKPENPGSKPGSATAILEPCPHCGVYRTTGGHCGCEAGSRGKG